MGTIASIAERLEALSAEKGPRPPGSDREAVAADYAYAQLRAEGLETQYQHFRAPRGFSLVYPLAFFLTLLAVALYPFRAGLGALGTLVAALGYVLETSTRPFFSRLLPACRGTNVIAKAHARSKELRRVLVLAHLDTPRYGRPWANGFPSVLQPGGTAATAGVLAPGLLYGLALFLPQRPVFILWFISLPFAVLVSGALVVALWRERGNESATGVDDNASGVVAMLETAKVIARAPLLTTSVWFVATGASGAGHQGVRHLIRECGLAPGKTMAINLDGVDAGRLAVTTAESAPIPWRSGASLVEAAGDAAAAKGIALDRMPWRATTDATAFLARRIPAVTITSPGRARAGADRGHGRADETAIVAARDLTLGMIRTLDG